jgi:hypothetical protein
MSNEWVDLAASATDDDLRERILTGFKDGKPFTPYVPTLPLPAPLDTVLDFGCGLGRNFPYLKSVAREVVGFDLPEMIDRCRRVSPFAAGMTSISSSTTPRLHDQSRTPDFLLSSDWEVVRTIRFDLVFASLVLQHIPKDWCAKALDDFAMIAPAVYLLARGAGDFGFSAIDLAVQSGRFEFSECRVVEHDPQTHQLRVAGTVPLAEARGATDPRHFEVLLHSRVHRR